MMTSIAQLNPTPMTKEGSSWIAAVDRLNFQQRVCSAFIAREINKKYCVCNRLESGQHKRNKDDHAGEVWDLEKHTMAIPTQCYGTFPHFDSPYLRCDIKTDLDQLCLMLLGVSGMHVPTMILHIMSDSNSMLNVKLERELLRGISDTAMASDACMITSCYKEDPISQLIGEVVYKSRVKNSELSFRAIGVGKWGNIRDRPMSKTKKDNNDDGKSEHRSGKNTLEPNLTHYIFFDDGTHHSMDTGQFASDLGKQLSCGARRKIPLVTTLVGGDLHTLKMVFKSLNDNHIPVVIIDQSGTLANVMCKYLKSTESILKSAKTRNEESADDEENEDEDNLDIQDQHLLQHYFEGMPLRKVLLQFGNMRWDILKDLRKLYGIIREQDYAVIGKKFPVGEFFNSDEEESLAKYIFWFAKCLSSPLRDQIHIYDLNNPSTSLQNKIYEALIQARENLSQDTDQRGMTTADQMDLALRWSVTDITKDQFISNTLDWQDSKRIKENRRLIFNALSKNSHVFISNVFKLGIDFAVLFGPGTDPMKAKDGSAWNRYLRTLYSDMIRKNVDSLYLLDIVDKRLTFDQELHLTRILQKLVGDFMEPIYYHPSSPISQRVTPELIENKYVSEYIYRDLFLWCVLTHRLEMAKIFLGQMKTRLCSALIASKILKSLATYAPDSATNEKINSEANDFETYAIECIRCSYFYDHDQACELIMRRVDLYGKVTCLQVAIAAEDKKFLYEDACNALLTNIWFDKEDPRQEQGRLFTNLLTMGISQVFFSMYDRHNDKKEAKKFKAKRTNETSIKRPLAKHGINYTDDYKVNEPIYKHVRHFHNTPIVKYYYTCFGYVLFLLFFSYYMLFAFDPTTTATPDIHWTEILTIIFVTTMLFEEFRQFYFQDTGSIMSKIFTYFDWNNRFSNLIVVLPAFLLFYIGLVLRFVISDPVQFAAARIVMAYDLELWFIRSILFIGIASNVGPRLVMIRKMTNDLLFFVFLIMVVIFGYGITSRAMTAYGTIDFDGREFFYKIIYPVYYFVLGSFDSERTNLDATPDAATTIATQVMFAFHMLFVNILLVNLLIALFTFTITNVQEQAKFIWAYDRCTLIRDYYARPAFFPPLTFLVSLFDIYQRCRERCRRYNPDEACFKMIPLFASVDDAWSEFERYSTNDYVRRLLDAQAANASDTITTDIDRSDVSPTNDNELKRRKLELDHLNEGLTRMRIDNNERSFSMELTVANLHNRVEQVDNRLDKISDALDWIMTAMERVKMSKTDAPAIKPKQSEPVADARQSTRRRSSQTLTQSRRMPTTAEHHISIPEKSSDDDKPI